jgi:hypothetical protein
LLLLVLAGAFAQSGYHQLKKIGCGRLQEGRSHGQDRRRMKKVVAHLNEDDLIAIAAQ